MLLRLFADWGGLWFWRLPPEVAALAAAATAETWDETFPDDGTLHPRADQVIAVEGEDLKIKFW